MDYFTSAMLALIALAGIIYIVVWARTRTLAVPATTPTPGSSLVDDDGEWFTVDTLWLRHFIRTVLWWCAVALTVIGLPAVTHLVVGTTTLAEFDGFQFVFDWSVLVILGLALMVPFSWKKIPAGSIGCLTIFGKPIRHLNSGPAFVPVLICDVTEFESKDFQDELPAEPEKVFHNEDKEKVPDGFVPPNRITFAEEPGATDPLKMRATAAVSTTITYNFDDVVRVITRLGSSQEDAIVNLRKQINDTSVATLADLFANQTLDYALRNKIKATAHVRSNVDKISQGKGVNVRDTAVKLIQLSHDLNSAMKGVQVAGYGVQTAELEGKAIEIKARTSQLTPKESLAFKVAEAAAANGKNVVIHGLDGVVKMAKDLVK